MPEAKDRNGGRAQYADLGMLRSAILLALPWLSLQRDLLKIIKTGLEPVKRPPEADGNTPLNHILVDLIQKATSQQLLALLMILDPAHAWRNGIGEDLQQKIASDASEISQHLAAGAVNVMEAQTK